MIVYKNQESTFINDKKLGKQETIIRENIFQEKNLNENHFGK